ncbi:MAG: hypothetical protein NTY01_01175, partial [Verrucomicrobia bacterium]|nr:hypothetical protein [Verrucomicrobiota bacterium]
KSIASFAPLGASYLPLFSHRAEPIAEIIHTENFCAPSSLISASLDLMRLRTGRYRFENSKVVFNELEDQKVFDGLITRIQELRRRELELQQKAQRTAEDAVKEMGDLLK